MACIHITRANLKSLSQSSGEDSIHPVTSGIDVTVEGLQAVKHCRVDALQSGGDYRATVPMHNVAD